MSCPICSSTDLTHEYSSGYSGYTCDACGRWSYAAEVNESTNNYLRNHAIMRNYITNNEIPNKYRLPNPDQIILNAMGYGLLGQDYYEYKLLINED